MSPADVASHLEIQQVLYRYCRAIDRGDLELLKSVYHPDAYDAHGDKAGPAHEFAVKIISVMDALGVTGQHIIANVLIELDGDKAQVESYFQAFHPAPAESGAMALSFTLGRYLDRFERRDGVWRIADRRVVFDHTRAAAEFPTWSNAANYPQGGRREADPSYGMFGASAPAKPTAVNRVPS